ncbi:MAG: SH3 domain-containing protein [Candidatus Omnitrophica bacterium]|nr:SH3 domain-containing protein [Candidatus Omnitrophota bacterium]
MTTELYFPRRLFAFLLVALFVLGCSDPSGALRSAAPAVVPGTTREMKTSGFWISRHPSPDKVILSAEEIKSLNSRIENELKLTRDVAKIDPLYSGKELTLEFRESLDSIREQKLYGNSDRLVGDDFYRRIEQGLNLRSVPANVEVRYGFVVHFADQRVLPTDSALYAKPNDTDFDELQNSGLDVGTPLAILHEGADGEWLYVISPLSSGWVRKDKVAFCRLDELKNYLAKTDYAVAVSSKADIFLDPSLTQYYDYIRMGARFPVSKRGGASVAEIIIPIRTADGKLSERVAYIKKEDVNFGYLAYTPRVIIEQAFKLLNSPYGWGDINGEQDCSRFIQEVFATVGIELPRNSSAQAEVGVLLGKFKKGAPKAEKLRIISGKAVGGVTVLHLTGPNHIMLFLGMFDGRPYAIHAVWGYRERGFFKDRVRVLKRVAVTGLSLGEGSRKGALIERVTTVRSISE